MPPEGTRSERPGLPARGGSPSFSQVRQQIHPAFDAERPHLTASSLVRRLAGETGSGAASIWSQDELGRPTQLTAIVAREIVADVGVDGELVNYAVLGEVL